MNNGLKVFLYIIVSIFISANAIAQVTQSDLLPLLSSSYQKNYEKIELNYTKGRALEDEANKTRESGSTDKETARNNKKYTIKRLEASQFYQKANSLYIDLLKDNISNFKKINKNLQIDIFTRNKEDQASELAREARSIRYVAEDLTYPEEKLSKIIEAEETEKEAVSIYIKVLYAYLNQPVAYDVPKAKNNGITLISENTDSVNLTVNETTKENGLEYSTLPKTNKDSLPSQQISEKKDSVTSYAIIPEVSPSETSLNVISERKDTSINSGSIYDMVDVKENQLDRFNKFLVDSFPYSYENYVINFRDLDYSDIESLKQAWHLYLYSLPSGKSIEILSGNDSFQPSNQLVPNKNSKLNSTELVITQNSEMVANNSEPNKNTKAEKSTEVKNGISDKDINFSETKKVELANPKIDSESDNSKFSEENTVDNTTMQIDRISNPSIEVAKGFLYRVQVSACRIPLDANSLKGIYNGELQVMELNEDKWFKYAVGEFNTYNQARILKEQLGVPGAFVIAYLNGKRINIINTTSQISGIHLADNSGIIYKVQIVAAKAPLDKNYILNIYNGSNEVEENLEDGWYKYSIVIGSSLPNAKNFIESENIPGAFITSYLDNKRIELKEAIRISKSNK